MRLRLLVSGLLAAAGDANVATVTRGGLVRAVGTGSATIR